MQAQSYKETFHPNLTRLRSWERLLPWDDPGGATVDAWGCERRKEGARRRRRDRCRYLSVYRGLSRKKILWTGAFFFFIVLATLCFKNGGPNGTSHWFFKWGRRKKTCVVPDFFIFKWKLCRTPCYSAIILIIIKPRHFQADLKRGFVYKVLSTASA